MMSDDEECFMCKHNSKVLYEATKTLPDNICLTIAMMAGCKRCEIDAEMLAIADEIKILKKKRSKNRDRIFYLERKGDKLYKQMEQFHNEHSDIYNMYPQ